MRRVTGYSSSEKSLVGLFSTKNETKRKVASYYTSKYNGGHFGSTLGHVTYEPKGGSTIVAHVRLVYITSKIYAFT